MSVERIVMAFAGAMVLFSLALAHFFGGWWLALTAFVGVNLLIAAFTGFCALARLLRRFGVESSGAL
jgi:hypothetical protein